MHTQSIDAHAPALATRMEAFLMGGSRRHLLEGTSASRVLILFGRVCCMAGYDGWLSQQQYALRLRHLSKIAHDGNYTAFLVQVPQQCAMQSPILYIRQALPVLIMLTDPSLGSEVKFRCACYRALCPLYCLGVDLNIFILWHTVIVMHTPLAHCLPQ